MSRPDDSTSQDNDHRHWIAVGKNYNNAQTINVFQIAHNRADVVENGTTDTVKQITIKIMQCSGRRPRSKPLNEWY